MEDNKIIIDNINIQQEKKIEIENENLTFTNNIEFQIDLQLLEKIKNLENFDQIINLIIQGTKLDHYVNIIIKQILENNSTNIITNLYEKSIFKPFSNIIHNNQEELNFTISNFFLQICIQFDTREKIYQNIIIINKIYTNAIHLIHLLKNYKKTIPNFIIPNSIKQNAIKNLFKINNSFLKDYINLFELKSELYPELIFKLLNELIDNNQSTQNLTNLIRTIEFFINYTKDEKIEVKLNNSQKIESKINLNNLLKLSLKDKKFYNITKKILRIIPESTEEVIRLFLKIKETKQASDLAKDFKEFISSDIIEEIIYHAQLKGLSYHYYRYFNYEIDINQLTELFIDNPQVMSHLANKFCQDKFYSESYFVLKLFDFDLNLIMIEEKHKYNLISFLLINSNSSLNKKFKKNSNFNQDFLKSFINEEKVNIYIEDFFGPLYQSCIQIDLHFSNIIFISNKEDLYKIKSLDRNELIGIDFEWKSVNSILEKNKGVALMQLATRDEAFIFDLFKLNDERNQEFFDKFSEMFEDKTFLGFSLKGDIHNISGNIKKFLIQKSYLDITEFYKNKYEKNCPSLSECCKQILNMELCKAEQVSNWEIRPLRLRQMHYAALDAFILLKLYDKLK